MKCKKIISIALVASMAATMMTACGGGDKKTTSGSGSGESKKLVIWGGVPKEDGPADIINAWNEKHPDVQAEYERFVNDDTGNTKLDTALQSGEQIDVFFTYSADNLTKRAGSGMIEDLGEFAGKDFVKDEIAGGLESVPVFDDKVYGIPTVAEPIGIMINKDILDEKGVTIPDNWTIQDYKEVSEKLSGEEDGKKVYGSSAVFTPPMDIAGTTLGGDEFYKSDTESNFDNKLFTANTLFKEMMDNGSAMPYEEIFSRKLDVYSHPAYLSGEIAMIPFSAWMLRYVNDKENFPHDFVTTFAPIPRFDESTDNPYQSTNNNWLCMNSQSENKEEAWELIKFWTTDGSKYVAKMPAWSGADEEAIINNILGENPEERFDVDKYKEVMLRDDFKYNVPTKNKAFSEISQIYKEETQNFFLGTTSADDYYKNMKQRSDQAIADAE